jgi:hypothetical protein
MATGYLANRDRFHFGTTSTRAAVQPACALTLLAFSVTLSLFETVPGIRQPRGRGRKAVFNNQSEIQAVAGTGPSKAASSQN